MHTSWKIMHERERGGGRGRVGSYSVWLIREGIPADRSAPDGIFCLYQHQIKEKADFIPPSPTSRTTQRDSRYPAVIVRCGVRRESPLTPWQHGIFLLRGFGWEQSFHVHNRGLATTLTGRVKSPLKEGEGCQNCWIQTLRLFTFDQSPQCLDIHQNKLVIV